MTLRGTYETLEQMERIVAMWAMEGLTPAVNQMDALLAAGDPYREAHRRRHVRRRPA